MAFAIPEQRFIMVYHMFYPLMEVKCYTNDGLLMELGWKGHHSEQTNRTSPTQFVFPSSSELRLFQCKKHRYLKQKNAIICLCQLLAMSYQCTYAPVYPDSIDFLKGHTFHPHSATAWQHPGHSYDFLLYFPRKSSGHLPVLFMTPFHVSHSRTPRKGRSFLQDPIQMVKNWTVSIFLGVAKK